jgi:hypothetical protein
VCTVTDIHPADCNNIASEREQAAVRPSYEAVVGAPPKPFQRSLTTEVEAFSGRERAGVPDTRGFRVTGWKPGSPTAPPYSWSAAALGCDVQSLVLLLAKYQVLMAKY